MMDVQGSEILECVNEREWVLTAIVQSCADVEVGTMRLS